MTGTVYQIINKSTPRSIVHSKALFLTKLYEILFSLLIHPLRRQFGCFVLSDCVSWQSRNRLQLTIHG